MGTFVVGDGHPPSHRVGTATEHEVFEKKQKTKTKSDGLKAGCQKPRGCKKLNGPAKRQKKVDL